MLIKTLLKALFAP